MDLTFLGTGSAYPSLHRGASSMILRTAIGYWMFDCGEGTQVQLMKSPVRPGKITKIFITHLHGDHVFGLPGLLCTVSMNSAEEKAPLDIYGPVGLRRFLRVSLELSRSIMGFKYRVHELVHDIKHNEISDWQPSHIATGPLHISELAGNDIIQSQDGFWHVCKEGPLEVKAATLKHRIASFGFVIQEDDQPGKFDVTAAKALGLEPGPLFGKLQHGETVTAPDGSVVHPYMVLGPSKPGRKLVILGDTCDSSAIAPLCMNANILVHEATNENELQAKTVEFGHSTPRMAGEFARSLNVRQLILTHFSQRYRPDDKDVMDKLLHEAKIAFQSQNVLCAFDLMKIDIIS